MKVSQPVAELVAVADSFYIKPLRRFLPSVDRYHVLGLSLHAVPFFEATRQGLDEIDLLLGVPRTITKALGGKRTKPHQTVASYGGVDGAPAPMHHGHAGKAAGADVDAERFFRGIDRAVLEHYSRPSGLPLLLAALPQHHHLFRPVSQISPLVTEGIMCHPGFPVQWPDGHAEVERRARQLDGTHHGSGAACGRKCPGPLVPRRWHRSCCDFLRRRTRRRNALRDD